MRELIIALVPIVVSFSLVATAGDPMPQSRASIVVATPIKKVSVEDLKTKVVYCKKTKGEEKLCVPAHKANCLCANE